jgi:PRTRC genetic system ThiF family protein
MVNYEYMIKNIHPITITVIGAGGNGSLLINQLARINVALKALGRKGIHVNLFDHDIVTEANVGRQMFSPSDIGSFKSTCVITRVNRFFGTSWKAFVVKIEDKDVDIDEFSSNIIITCTDNRISRLNVKRLLDQYEKENYIDVYRTFFWLDLGNRKDIGQIIMGTYLCYEKLKLPTVVDYFENYSTEPDDDNTPSCSLAEALEKQDLFINSFVTNVAAKLLWDILTKSSFDWHGAFINTRTLNIKKLKC